MSYRIDECCLVDNRWVLSWVYDDSGDRYLISDYSSLENAEAAMRKKIKEDAEKKRRRKEARSYTYDENGVRFDG